MKKSRILSKPLNDALADMGHGDVLVICDAGFPIPPGKRVDLALEQDKPSILEVLDLVMSDFIYEKCVVAEEQQAFNPPLHQAIVKLCTRCPVELVKHADFIQRMPQVAKYIVRTGSFEPWGNLALTSGVDAPIWFQKPGVVTPDYYQQRAGYQEGK